MARQNPKFHGMKSSNVNMRVRDDLRPVVEYLKLLPGGITAWFEEKLSTVEVDRELLDKLMLARLKAKNSK